MFCRTPVGKLPFATASTMSFLDRLRKQKTPPVPTDPVDGIWPSLNESVQNETVVPNSAESAADVLALTAAFRRAGENALPSFDEEGLRVLVEMEATRAQEHIAHVRFLSVVAIEDEPWAPDALLALVHTPTVNSWRSTAALHAALYPRFEGDTDPVGRARILHAEAVSAAGSGDEGLALAIWTGLIAIGEVRILDVVGPCWRMLSSEARVVLANAVTERTVYARVVLWLVDWLGECERMELSHVAATLFRLGERAAETGVIDIARRLPDPEPKRPGHISVVQKWSREGFVVRIRDLLLRAAADEEPPCLLHPMLLAWGITHTERWPSDVTRTPVYRVPRELLLLLPPEARHNSSRFPLVPLDDDDFLASDGELLVSWGIFNPNGPTWNCIGLLPTEDANVSVLFWRSLNPFDHPSYALATLVGAHRSDDAVAGRCIQQLFATTELESVDGSTDHLIRDTLPTFYLSHGRDLLPFLLTGMMESSRLRTLNAVGPTRMMAAHLGDPWERTRQERNLALLIFAKQQPAREQEGRVTDEQLHAYLRQALSDEHRGPELVSLPDAWHGAIDHAMEPWTDRAYSFWRLEDFLARYGFRAYRT